MNTRYRVEDNVPAGKMRRAARKTVPLGLLGLAAYALWQKRDAITEFAQKLKTQAKAGGAGTGGTFSTASAAATPEQVPADYDWNRPSVFNSTAMAGPEEGAGATVGYPGGTLGTDPGTQGEGAQ